MSSTTIDRTVTDEDFACGVVLSNDFRMNNDGWMYPQDGKPLVRVYVGPDTYIMERRRTPESVWMQIVHAPVSDFDQVAFEQWTKNWPLTV